MNCAEFLSRVAKISIAVIDNGLGGIREVSELSSKTMLIVVDSGDEYLVVFTGKGDIKHVIWME